MNLIALVAAGCAVSLVSFAVLELLFSEERRVRRRLSSLEAYTAASITDAEPLAAPFRERVLGPGMARMVHLIGSIAPSDYRERLRKRVLSAGGSGRLGPDRVLLLKVVAGTAGVLLSIMLVRASHLGWFRGVLITVVVGLVLWLLPDLVLSARASARQRQIVRELPDMLDMLTISVEAGLGFDQAVSRYIRHSRGPLGKEFGIALMEIQAGKARREALRSMADRADVPELNAFVMAIVQADVFGVSVSDVLRTQSREMRVKRRQRAEEMAQKAPAKMAFPLVICILPATLIVVIAPAVIGLMRLFGG